MHPLRRRFLPSSHIYLLMTSASFRPQRVRVVDTFSQDNFTQPIHILLWNKAYANYLYRKGNADFTEVYKLEYFYHGSNCQRIYKVPLAPSVSVLKLPHHTRPQVPLRRGRLPRHPRCVIAARPAGPSEGPVQRHFYFSGGWRRGPGPA